MSAPATTAELIDLVRKSGLIEATDLDAYLQQRGRVLPSTPADAAGDLVRDGLLTGFQSSQLLKGRTRGFVIAGKYKVLEHLGSGGMASVFLCEHTAMRRRVALKVLPTAQANDPASLERFYREARAAASLDHPNIVRAHDIDRDGKMHFLVMEYIDGASLQDLVRRKGYLDVLRACHYVRQAALGLHHAHEAGLVHRDIKPGNLILDRTGTVKILDMGLARFFTDDADDTTKRYDENAVLGTADYCAPEQAMDSHNADIRADIYSLGATFYFLLTGQTPFGPGTTAQKIIWHQMKAPPPLRDLRPTVPEGLADIVERMMAKNPDERFQTPAEVYDALAPWTTRPISPPTEDEMPRGGRGGSGSSIRSAVRPTSPKPRSLPSSGNSATKVLSKKGKAVAPESPWRKHRVPLAAGGGGVLLLLLVLLTWAIWPKTPATTLPTGRPPVVAGPPAAPPPPAVLITPLGKGRHVKTPRYEAHIADDCCLQSLKIGGIEFFKPGIPYGTQSSRGLYFHSDRSGGQPPLTEIEQRGNLVITRGKAAVLLTTFEAEKISWRAINLTDDPLLKLYAVFDPAVTAVRFDDGSFAAPPVVREGTTTTSWFAGASRLTLQGGTRIWGPWPDTIKPGYQVWQLSLPPKGEAIVTALLGEATPEERQRAAALTGALAPPAPATAVALESPLEGQVFQRATKQSGEVRLRGVAAGADRVEARLTGTSLSGPLPDVWREVAPLAAGRFDLALPVAAGGWYRLEVRAYRGAEGVGAVAVDRVGVGEVFVGAGQSNSTNSGEERLKVRSGLVSSFDGTRWQPADDPQPGTHDKSTGGSFWPAFGDALAEKYKVPIGVAVTGHGGTTAAQWEPRGELFAHLAARLKALGPNGCRAVLWHQGEQDAGNTDAGDYTRRLTEIIQASRTLAGWEVPWLVAQATYRNPSAPASPTLRAAQKQLWDTKVALPGPDTDALTGDHRDQGGQGIHFSGKGLRAHGLLWAEKVAPLLD